MFILIHAGGYSILLILMYVAVIVTLVTLIVMGSWHRKQRCVPFLCFINPINLILFPVFYFFLPPFLLSSSCEIKVIIFSYSSNRNVLSSYISNPTFPLENDTQCPRSSALQLHSAQESWIKNRILKWKRSLNQFW